MLLVTHGLISNQDGLTLHPDLFLWENSLKKYKRQWFKSSSYNPLGTYAALLSASPALLLASKLSLNTAKQYWVASPYHAQLTRDSVRVMPESMLPWCEEDAVWACKILNPLLSEEGMQLHAIGAALLLACEKPLHAAPAVFSEISGKSLPNRHPKGKDGGHFMRLIAEVQMLFKQHPAQHRRQRGEVDVHGLWFWGGVETRPLEPQIELSIASRDPFLNTVCDAKNAKIIITEPEQLIELIRQGADLPKRIVLFGDDIAVLLKKSLLPPLGNKHWQAKTVSDASMLFSLLQK